MKKYFVIMIFMLIFASMSTGCAKIDKGYEGAKINTLGTDKGETQILSTGRHYYNPIKYDIIRNPIFRQEYVWTSSKDEGSPTDESITFQSSNSLKFTANVGISFSLIPGKSGELYEKYHKNIRDMIDTNIRNSVRDAFNRAASDRDAEKIYGKGKNEFIKDVTKDVSEYWKDFFIIHKIYLVGPLDPPAQIRAAINKKIEAIQKAQQRENEVAEAIASANKKIETQRGESESRKMEADAAAYELERIAEAEAKSIKLITDQLKRSPEYIELERVKKWNGALPQYMNGEIPMFMKQLK